MFTDKHPCLTDWNRTGSSSAILNVIFLFALLDSYTYPLLYLLSSPLDCFDFSFPRFSMVFALRTLFTMIPGRGTHRLWTLTLD